MSNLYKTWQNFICIIIFMFVRFVVELPTFQCITTNVSDNNKQYRYISVLLLWSQIVLVCCFKGKCLMHWSILVECWGESYCWLMLVEIINCNVCDCAEKVCSTYVADSIQQLDYVKICLRIILKWTLKNWRVYLWRLNWIGSIYNLIISHDIW